MAVSYAGLYLAVTARHVGQVEGNHPHALSVSFSFEFSGLRLCSKSAVAVDLRWHCVCTEF